MAALALIVAFAGGCNRGGADGSDAASVDPELCDGLWDMASDGLEEALFQELDGRPGGGADRIVEQWVGATSSTMKAMTMGTWKLPGDAPFFIAAKDSELTCQVAASATGPRSAKLVQRLPDGTTRDEALEGYAESEEEY